MKGNKYAKILDSFGIILLGLGIIGGLVVGTQENWINGIQIIFDCFVSGLILMGISEVIHLLQEINNKVK